MLNPAHIDIFRAVLQYGGMTRAAEALGMGQPHISRAMAQLEAEIGFQLFVRGHGSASPTEEGCAFAHEVARTYAGLQQLQRAADQIREIGTGVLRIACQPSLARQLVPRAIRKLAALHPSVQVSLYVPAPDTIWSWVEGGQCEIGLVRPREDASASVESRTFLTVDAHCAVPRDHPLARKRSIAATDLEGVPIIAGAPGAFQNAVEAALSHAGIVPRFSLLAQYTAARCGLVAEGMGVAIVDPLPARALAHLPIVLKPFRPAVPIQTVLIQPGGKPAGILARRFISLLNKERDDFLQT